MSGSLQNACEKYTNHTHLSCRLHLKPPDNESGDGHHPDIQCRIHRRERTGTVPDIVILTVVRHSYIELTVEWSRHKALGDQVRYGQTSIEDLGAYENPTKPGSFKDTLVEEND